MLAQRRFSGQSGGSQEEKLLWDCSWSSLERQSTMTSHDLLLFISAVQKKKNKPQCLTLQTNHTDFGYKAHCKFAQFREEFLYWWILAGSSPASAGRTAEELICVLSSSSAAGREHPKKRAPQGKWISPVASKTLALCSQALRTLAQTFPSNHSAAVCHSCLSSTAQHSSWPQTELPSSQVTVQRKQWLFLHPAI